MNRWLLFIIGVFFLTCCSKPSPNENQLQAVTKLSKEEIIDKYLKKGAWRYWIFAPEWQTYIDSALAIDPSIGYLYQQKAMPFIKSGKLEVALEILDKGVAADSSYIDYRAFVKCIFARQYRDAIDDFTKAKEWKGENQYVMDHSYHFYIGASYLQLNEFENAIENLQRSIDLTNGNGEQWVHHLDLFYMGIAHQELKQHEEAIRYFDRALKNYERFSDAEFYKVISLISLRKNEEAVVLAQKCKADFEAGMTINEGNSKYEFYPYQINSLHIDVLKLVK